MIRIVVLISLIINVPSLYAQDLNGVGKKLRGVKDSVNHIASAQFLKDSLKMNSWSDALKEKIRIKFRSDSVGLVERYDRVGHVTNVKSGLERSIDSLRVRREILVSEIEEKRTEVIAETKGKVDGWKHKVYEKIDNKPSLNNHIPDANLPSGNVHLSDLHLSDLPELPQLEIPEIKKLELSPELFDLNQTLSFEIDQLEGVSKASEKLSGFGEQITDVKEHTSALSDLKQNPDKFIDHKLGEVSEVADVREELLAADGIRDNEFLETAESLKNPEAAKEELKQIVVVKAVNHFEGREEVLQQAMDKMTKYKVKYESLDSLSELKKLSPNPMKGKPFIERLVPGIAFQVLKDGDLFLDINPYIGYRLTGRLASGAGWNQRIGYSTSNHYITSGKVIYGPRIYVEYKVWKGFSIRVEEELMNTFVSPNLSNTENGQREWVFSSMLGLKSEYRITRYMKGTAFVKFNLFNREHKSPYGDVVNSRFGFEVMMKKKGK